MALFLIASVSPHAQEPAGSPTTGQLFISKTDEGNTGLPGATIDVFQDNPPVGGSRGPNDTPIGLSCTSGPDGNCTISGIPFGTYWVAETIAPDGYTAQGNAGHHHVTLNEEHPSANLRFPNVPVPENVRVNDPTGDAGVGDGTHRWQFGGSITADPVGRRALTVFDDTPHLGDGGSASMAGFASTRDGGMRWTDGGEVPAGDALILGDSDIVFDLSTQLWWIVVSACFRDASNQARCSPAVLTTEFGAGQDPSFSPPVFVDENIPPFPAFGHSAVILVDTNPDSPFRGRVYVIWTRSNADETSQIFLSYTDEFLGDFTTIPISSVGHFDFPDAVVSPVGTLHVTWVNTDPAFDIFTVKSTDGGATFTDEVIVAENVPRSGTPGMCDGRTTRLLSNGIEATDRPLMEANPQNPRWLMVAYTAQGQADGSDVFVTGSADGGTTWRSYGVVPPFDGEQTGLDVEMSPLGVAHLLSYSIDPEVQAEGIDVFMASMRWISEDPYVDFLPSQRVNSVPFGVPRQDPPSDTSGPPCNGLGPTSLRLTFSAFAVWTDGRDVIPGGEIDPNIYFAHVQTPRVPTETTVDVDKTRTRLNVSGELNPSLAGDRLTVTLFHDDGDGFERIGRKRVGVNARHRYATSFDRPEDGRCRVVAKFAGTEEQRKSSARTTFAC